jgi:hypothetical protein
VEDFRSAQGLDVYLYMQAEYADVPDELWERVKQSMEAKPAVHVDSMPRAFAWIVHCPPIPVLPRSLSDGNLQVPMTGTRIRQGTARAGGRSRRHSGVRHNLSGWKARNSKARLISEIIPQCHDRSTEQVSTSALFAGCRTFQSIRVTAATPRRDLSAARGLS